MATEQLMHSWRICVHNPHERSAKQMCRMCKRPCAVNHCKCPDCNPDDHSQVLKLLCSCHGQDRSCCMIYSSACKGFQQISILLNASRLLCDAHNWLQHAHSIPLQSHCDPAPPLPPSQRCLSELLQLLFRQVQIWVFGSRLEGNGSCHIEG